MDFATGGRPGIAITADDVGSRVSVRRLTEPGSGAERFTDTVGVLTAWDANVLRITRRDGATVRIVESSLVAAKVVPAAPDRRRGPSADWRELTLVAARGWPPVVGERLGEWELRWAGGFTRRANSALPLGDPGMPPQRALERVVAWYAERGLPAYVQVATGAAGTQEHLAAELAACGWTREVSSRVLTAPLARVSDAAAARTTAAGGIPAADGAAPEAGHLASRVVLSRTLDASWLARHRSGAGLPPEALAVLGGGPSVWFAAVPAQAPADGWPGRGVLPPAAVGRCVVDGRWAGFTSIEVDPARRRRGLASAVMAALARRALQEGASAAYLQVEQGNQGAGALYDALGFGTHHSYHHWRAPAGPVR